MAILGKNPSARDIAKERLRMVLIHDRASTNEDFIPSIKERLITVVSEYVELDKEGVQIELTQSGERTVLITNIPVTRVKRGA
jgi:cell division topological specificity factor